MTLPLEGLPPGPKVVGIDLSLTATGIGLIADHRGFTKTIRTEPRRGHVRLEYLAAEVVRAASGADLVLIEGAAFGKPHQAFNLGGCWWVVTHELWRAHIYHVIVPPACVKKYATGKGNAPKDTVLAAAIRRYPDVAIENNNEADGFVLTAMGADWLGHAFAKVPEANRAGLDAIKTWPASVERPWTVV